MKKNILLIIIVILFSSNANSQVTSDKLLSNNNITITGETPGARFGNSVASTGDVNGDSFEDMIVGSEGYNVNTGRVYLYFGGTQVDTIPDIIFNGESQNNFLDVQYLQQEM